jgi:predicted phage terminase large subunit-like protein
MHSGPTRADAAAELLRRREIQGDLVSWARHYLQDKAQEPAKHHLLLLNALQKVTDQNLLHPETGLVCNNLIVLMPPGSAKSTYISVAFPPWFLQRRSNSRILACSAAADLIESFSRECRNAIALHYKVLGYKLREDSRAIQEWSTTNGGTYRCAGVGGTITGRRADCGFIDDYLGSQEDADSKLIRDKQWAWYQNDYDPRLKPNAIQIIVANRRHEEDLVGMILNRFSRSWVVISLPFFPEPGDVLDRQPVDRAEALDHVDITTVQVDQLVNDPKVQPLLDSRIWPEYFTREQAATVLLKPARTQSGLYQQRPAPEEGDYFKAAWLRTYTQKEYDELMRRDHRVYGAGDWAVSEEDDANRSCFGGCALDGDRIIYILPDLFWKVAGPKEVISNYIAFLKRRDPLMFWSEKGHISKAWGPFLQEMMVEENVFSYISEVTPSRAKDIRARSVQGLMSMGRVRFPAFAHWWDAAKNELLTFPAGATDDFVDFLAHLGAGVISMMQSTPRRQESTPDINKMVPITLSWIKKSDKDRKRHLLPKYEGR